jgi:hypothetical protein
MTLRTLAVLSLLVLTTSCSLLPTKTVTIVSKPVEIEIIQPTLPRPLELGIPKWYVVSEARIANPCQKVMKLDENGEHIVNADGTHQTTRPKTCELEDRDNPEWPSDYTYLDRFIEEIKDQNNGDIVFVATTVGDYKVMIQNNQELRRYIQQIGEVIVVYRNVTMSDKQKGVVAEVQVKK